MGRGHNKKVRKREKIGSKGAIVGKVIGTKVEIQERTRNKELTGSNEKKHKFLR